MNTEIEAAAIAMITENNRLLKKAGDDLAIAAIRVTTDYDGVHRLRLAVAAWNKAVADEGGRAERYAKTDTGAGVAQR